MERGKPEMAGSGLRFGGIELYLENLNAGKRLYRHVLDLDVSREGPGHFERYGAGESEREGTVKHSVLSLNGQDFMAIDSGLDHRFTFTPAMPIYVQCDSEKEIDEPHKRLSEGGEEEMPLGNYGFSKKFAWLDDKYGVSWQSNLAK